MKAITIESIGKQYDLNQYTSFSLRDALAPKRMVALLKKYRDRRNDFFWALKDISFQIDQGEIVGIIGRNGSGKSTLLKILARITPPTCGTINLFGSISALLEVGAGFHLELSGRENIFLSGYMTGASKATINKKLDEIIAFSELDRYIDIPLKYYSSGMYMRLAFSVAIHLGNEILLLDEVLAVGDILFQKKCQNIIHSLAKNSGKTIIIVSHDLNIINTLCSKTIWLESGRLLDSGNTETIINKYATQSNIPSSNLNNREDRYGLGNITVINANIESSQTPIADVVKVGEQFSIVITLKNRSDFNLEQIQLDIGVNSPTGQRISWLSTSLSVMTIKCYRGSTIVIRAVIPKNTLLPGLYSFNLYCASEYGVEDWIKNALFLQVVNGIFFESGLIPPLGQGFFIIDHKMTYEAIN